MPLVSLDTQLGFGPPTALTIPVVVGLVLLIGGGAALLVIQRRTPTRSPQQPPHPTLPYPPPGPPPFHHQQQPPGMWPPPQSQGYQKVPATKGGTAQGLAIVTLIFGGLLLLVRFDTDAPPPPGLLANQIVIADTAGGLQRVEPSAAVVEDMEKRTRAGAQFEYATYQHPKFVDAEPGEQVLSLLFIGIENHSNEPETTSKNYFDVLARQGGPFVSGISEHPAGELGGLLRCASIRIAGEIEVHCIWVDSSTFGHLVAAQLTESEVAAVLLRMRPDLEKPR